MPILEAEITEDIKLTAKIFNKVADIPQTDWERIYPDVFESYSFFKTLDECLLEQFEFIYIAIYEAEELVGVAPCFLMNYPLETTIQGFFKTFILKLKKFFPHFLELKALVCGLPMGQGRMGLAKKPSAVFAIISTTLKSLAQARGISVVAFKDFDMSYDTWLDPLQDQGYFKFESLPSTEMDVRFESFDQYLKSLSRVSRDGLKRKLKKINKFPIQMEVVRRLSEDESDAVYILYRQTIDKHTDLSFEIMPRNFFKIISDHMSKETRYFLWRLDGKIVAFALCFVSDECLVDYYLGLDYSIANDYHIYFARFCDLVKWCIENKIPKYEMGNTGYEAKRRFGFKFIRIFGYVKHCNRFINPFFHWLCKLLKPENYDEVFTYVRQGQNIRQSQS